MTPLACIAAPETAAIESGTSWMFSTRFWAVTMTTSDVAAASVCAVAALALRRGGYVGGEGQARRDAKKGHGQQRELEATRPRRSAP